MKINWVDILIVIYIVRSFFLGKKRGFSVEITSFITAILTLVIALHFYQDFGQSLSKWFLLTLTSARAISFIAISIFILFLGAILARLLKRIMKLSFLVGIEKIGGYILGTLKGCCISAIVTVALVLSSAGFVQQEVYTNSFLGNYLVALSPKIHDFVWPNSPGENVRFNVRRFWDQLPQKPKGEIL